MSEVIAVESIEEMDDILNNNEVVIVDFWATWCGPCAKLKPHFEKAASSVDVPMVTVEIESQPWAVERYGIQGVPRVVEFVGGELTRDIKGRTVLQLLDEIG